MNFVNETGAYWLVSLYNYLLSLPDISKNSFVRAGITDAGITG